MSAYLDHAASTPMLPEAAADLVAALAHAGNASSLHAAGRRARRTVEESREELAAALGARPSEVVLTSGGTEADNLAVLGIARARRAQDPRRTRVLVSAVEHHAVLDPARWLAEREGFELVLLPVDATGRVDVEALAAELEAAPDRAALVSVMWANNEVGTVQPLAEVVSAARALGVPVHADAAQAVGQLDVDFAACGLDAMTIAGHKYGGPVGAGALLLRREVAVEPVQHGGGQERGLRSGTLDTPQVRALATATRLAAERRPQTAARLAGLRDDLLARVRAAVPDAVLRGPEPSDGRLPGNAHLTFPGCEGDSLLYLLDSAGVQCSTGSACQAGVPQPSHVLLAMGVPAPDARGALRFSLGHTSTAADVDALVAALPAAVERARAAGLASSAAAPRSLLPVRAAGAR